MTGEYFNNLESGDAFEFNGIIYIKLFKPVLTIEGGMEEKNCINLNIGIPELIADDCIVNRKRIDISELF